MKLRSQDWVCFSNQYPVKDSDNNPGKSKICYSFKNQLLTCVVFSNCLHTRLQIIQSLHQTPQVR